LNNTVRTAELFTSETGYLTPFFEGYEYPWHILPEIKGYIQTLLGEGIDGFTEISEGVLVGEGARIHPSAVILPPAIIGKGCELRPGAYIRGCVITGEGCIIGNSTEVKNSLLSDGVCLPHYNYVGDSVLGMKVHMGAGAICSNLKADGGNVVIRGEREYDTGLRKVGGFLGDGADIGCGSVLNPGTVVGRGTSVYPLTSLRGVYPSNSIVKGTRDVTERD